MVFGKDAVNWLSLWQMPLSGSNTERECIGRDIKSPRPYLRLLCEITDAKWEIRPCWASEWLSKSSSICYCVEIADYQQSHHMSDKILRQDNLFFPPPVKYLLCWPSPGTLIYPEWLVRWHWLCLCMYGSIRLHTYAGPPLLIWRSED